MEISRLSEKRPYECKQEAMMHFAWVALSFLTSLFRNAFRKLTLVPHAAGASPFALLRDGDKEQGSG